MLQNSVWLCHELVLIMNDALLGCNPRQEALGSSGNWCSHLSLVLKKTLVLRPLYTLTYDEDPEELLFKGTRPIDSHRIKNQNWNFEVFIFPFKITVKLLHVTMYLFKNPFPRKIIIEKCYVLCFCKSLWCLIYRKQLDSHLCFFTEYVALFALIEIYEETPASYSYVAEKVM